MGYSAETRRRLFILSGNECAFPGCKAPVYDTDHNVMVGEFCHIKGKSPGGPRYDPNQSEEERNGYANLMLMCSPHNKIIDDPNNLVIFPVETLLAYKHEHESRFKNAVVKEDVLERFAKLIDRIQPPVASLTPVIEWIMTKPDNAMGLDYYDFRVALRNDGQKPVREFLVEVEIPSRYMQQGSSVHGEEQSHRPGYRLFRRTLAESMPPHVIHPRATRPVIQLSYIIKRQHYLLGIPEAISVRVYSADELISNTDYPIADMLNAERVEMILAPRMDAIRKICETAWNRVGENGDPTSELLYLSEQPTTEPSPRPRSVYIRDAYNMGKALEKAGWIEFESEDALSIRLTDEGVRAGS
jgi:hypothetical protein